MPDRQCRLHRSVVVTIAVAMIVGMAARPAAAACVGDCNGDGRVAVNELVTGVDMALNGGDICPPMECNDTGLGIIIDCLVIAVHKALTGCDPATVDAVWLYHVPCRQCGDCPLRTINDLLGIARDGIPDDVLPDDVTVLDARIEWVEGACLACGCPEPGSPIYHVLVPRADVDRLTGFGWVPAQWSAVFGAPSGSLPSRCPT
jgi:hypothetical protein